MRKKIHLMTGSSMGRILRAPPEDLGMGGGQQQQNNPQGNTGDQQTGGDSANNAGAADRLATFWDDPKPAAPATPAVPAVPNQNNSGGEQQQGKTAGQMFMEKMTSSFQVPDIWNPEIAQQLIDGDAKGFNESIKAAMQQTMVQSVQHAAALMKDALGQLEPRFQKMIEEKLGGEKNEQSLSKEFKSYDDPKIRPTIDRVFSQAMKHEGGDRVKALKLAKEMLAATNTGMAEDLGMNQRQEDQSSMKNPASQSLVDSLLGR